MLVVVKVPEIPREETPALYWAGSDMSDIVNNNVISTPGKDIV